MRKWTFIYAEGHKVIFASPEVVDLVKKVLDRRAVTINQEVPKDEAWVDNPGMVLMNRGIWSGVIDDLKVEIPVVDFHDFLRQIKQHLNDPTYNGDKDPDRGYRSIYGWMHCIALTQDQYQELHDLMVSEADAVQAQADEEDERLINAIQRANDDLKKIGSTTTIESYRTQLSTPLPINGKWN